MPQEPQEVAANEWGTVTHHPAWQALELKWDASTRSMTDDGFKQTLQILADQGLKVRPKFMIIDATEFFHRPGESTLAMPAGSSTCAWPTSPRPTGNGRPRAPS